MLQEYQRMVSSPWETMSESDAASLLLGGTLLNVTTFAALQDAQRPGPETNVDYDKTSWIYNPLREERKAMIAWLPLLVGARPLLMTMPAHLRLSIHWVRDVFFDDYSESLRFAAAMTGSQAVPAAWATLFGLTGSSENENADVRIEAPASCNNLCSPYYLAVTALAYLRHLEPTGSAVFQTFQFPPKLERDFLTLLYDRDERAVWLFGYWLGLMCRFEGFWWYNDYVKEMYQDILKWLEERLVDDTFSMKELEWCVLLDELRAAPECKHLGRHREESSSST